jgi:multidrug resistance efflux pump
VVREGALLAVLDDRDLRLERLKWLSQEDELLKQYRQALAERNAAQVEVYSAQLAQSRAQLALVDDQLARTQIRAPFDGVVVSGDLSQKLGAPVERGTLLYEIAPLNAYRVILQVDERDIPDLAVGQTGRLLLSAFPHEPIGFTVEKVTPVATASEGRNYFRAEAKLENDDPRLRPGMEGVGKVDIDRRRYVWIWTHQIIDWLRLKLWAWLP